MSTDPQDRGKDESRDWDELVLDEEFIRDAEVNEPAARTRMLQERWRHAPPEPQPWRADAPPAGWFFSRSRRQERKERKERKERGRWRRKKDD